MKFALGFALGLALGAGCGEPRASSSPPPARAARVAQRVSVDPTPLDVARARASVIGNYEAAVPPMCYTATGGTSNPCWVCHTRGQGRTFLDDGELQESYAFSETARTNHWTNLFVDRRPFIASISDDEILRWVRTDNYAPLRTAMAALPASYRGFRPDVELARGFDEHGFARDGSGWRAVRFQPFLGAFWPTNGSTSDAFIRLPAAFRTTPELYRLNLSIVEAAISIEDYANKRVDRAVEPIDERLLGVDLDRNGVLGTATRIRTLPAHYAGDAAKVPVVAQSYPLGTELLHSVRYLDPDQPTQMATRMKELRYMRKVEAPDDWGRQRAYEKEALDKADNQLPAYQGDIEMGFLTPFGWQLQGYIEDERGALRVQTDEEHRFCMGCHGNIGVTIDQVFSFARKVPGADGWRPQDLRGLRDRPQVGHAQPELVTYFTRVQGGDETRSNDELLARFFPDGKLDTKQLRRAAVGGDRDLAWALFPTRDRALALDKAYLAIVREQSFTRGRDAVLAPAKRVHPRIEQDDTQIREPHRDGRLHLRW
jgi:hypothetical protein